MIKDKNMNIAAELLEIANRCDMHNLTAEADILTEIAQTMLGTQKNTLQDMAAEEQQNMNYQEQPQF